MAKYVLPAVLDAALDEIATANLMVAVAGQPADYAAAQEGKLAEVALAPGDFTKANGVTSGRQVTVAEKPNAAVLVEGTADHVALLDTVGERVLYVTVTTAPQLLPVGGSVSFDTWSVEIGDPA